MKIETQLGIKLGIFGVALLIWYWFGSWVAGSFIPGNWNAVWRALVGLAALVSGAFAAAIPLSAWMELFDAPDDKR